MCLVYVVMPAHYHLIKAVCMVMHLVCTTTELSPVLIEVLMLCLLQRVLHFHGLTFFLISQHDPLLSKWLCLITIHWKSYPCALCLVCQCLFGLCNPS